jgi:hypothetical protein
MSQSRGGVEECGERTRNQSSAILYRTVTARSLHDFIDTIKKSTNKSPNVQIVNGQSSLFKGTVRPDWIRMRVVLLESPFKGHQPLYVFNF